MRVCPAFIRWDIYCPRCGFVFYVDAEPDSTAEEILDLPQIQCGKHPSEGSVVMLV